MAGPGRVRNAAPGLAMYMKYVWAGSVHQTCTLAQSLSWALVGCMSVKYIRRTIRHSLQHSASQAPSLHYTCLTPRAGLSEFWLAAMNKGGDKAGLQKAPPATQEEQAIIRTRILTQVFTSKGEPPLRRQAREVLELSSADTCEVFSFETLLWGPGWRRHGCSSGALWAPAPASARQSTRRCLWKLPMWSTSCAPPFFIPPDTLS